MNDNQKNLLSEAIRQLPEHTPRPGTWEIVARALDAEESFGRVLSQLPEREPREDTWNRIEEKLPRKQTSTVLIAWRYAAATAAIIVLAIGIHYYWQRAQFEPEVRLTYREEVTPAYAPDALAADDSLQQEAQSYIEQLCQQAPPATCQRPEFRALQAHLTELSEEEQALKQTMEQLGYDPQLVKYQVRIENMKAEATRELIQMVIG